MGKPGRAQSRLLESLLPGSSPIHFPMHSVGETSESLYIALNMIEPSMIRVEADEVTFITCISLSDLNWSKLCSRDASR